MRRHLPGLHSGNSDLVSNLEGLFLVKVERASYRWHPQKPYLSLRFSILEPVSFEAISFSGRLYCTERALGKLNGLDLMDRRCNEATEFRSLLLRDRDRSVSPA